MRALTKPTGSGPGAVPRPPVVRELLLVAGLFVVYKIGRRLALGRTDAAFRNADRMWDLERVLHLPGEGAVQSLLLRDDTMVHLANVYYATVHFPATVLFLVWLYLRRPLHYVWARRVLALVTAAALVLPFTFPLAPPRMLASTALVDTGRLYGPSVYGPPNTDHLSNQFAAMPSLHFGWALMVAIGLIAATRSRWRALWLVHPLITLTVIVGTANHYWLDAVAAAVMLGAALTVVPVPGRGGARAAGPARSRETAAAGGRSRTGRGPVAAPAAGGRTFEAAAP
ncbi:phosphatase PAP2 family protein [Streptomyces abyssomicinicus]|uniref:phosphatase PAP2 family protein n=1 Tax=Streptomyces abyssomicinicus TaxID=574929 RepID=UPI0012506C00|nr:phosphatase PAP2 family protein [Streptomyces abyssomicinicus]